MYSCIFFQNQYMYAYINMALFTHSSEHCKVCIKKRKYGRWKDVTLNKIKSKSVLAKKPVIPSMKTHITFLLGLSIWGNASLVLHQIKITMISVWSLIKKSTSLHIYLRGHGNNHGPGFQGLKDIRPGLKYIRPFVRKNFNKAKNMSLTSFVSHSFSWNSGEHGKDW